MVRVRFGKPIDSARLKTNIDKRLSIQAAKAASEGVAPASSDVDACPICRSKGSARLCEIYGFSYARCSDCGSAFVSNPPTPHALETLYSSDYYTASTRNLYANANVVDYRLKNIARPKVTHILESIHPRPRSWLDVGCGTGEILKVAADFGVIVHGVETNSMQREFARSTFGLNILGQFVSAETASQLPHADVISLFSVLEHILNPVALLEVISSKQQPGEHLVVEVPHFPSLSAASQVSFPDLVNRMVHPPLHLFLFSTEGLQNLLARHGYEVTDIWYFGQDIYEILTTLPLVLPQFQGSALQSTLLPLTNVLQEAVDKAGLSDEMLVIARKKSN